MTRSQRDDRHRCTFSKAGATGPRGRGAAHQALEEARERTKLHTICSAIGCAPTDVSADGIHAELPLVLVALRRHGYSVGEPRHAPAQVQPGYTIWHVRVALPNNGPSFALGYFTPNTS